MENDETDILDKPLMIFGRDVRKIPCFRSSLLYGLGSGLAGGLIVFMFTSKPRLGSHSAVGIFCSVTMCYWMVCRHRWADQKYSIGQFYGVKRRRRIEDPSSLEEDPKKIEIANI